tara:strand:+ start:260 stop:1075 length:816 start_codon:yes stop_codon:yes gene_type:complete
MPFLYWKQDNTFFVATQWTDKKYADEYLEEASVIDAILDNVLDDALNNLDFYEKNFEIYKSKKPFFREYSVGKALLSSKVLDHEYLHGEGTVERPTEILFDKGNLEDITQKGKNVGFYTALGEKANTGMSLKSDSVNPERWKMLRTSSQKRRGEKRDGKQDSYARAAYLAEQTIEDAVFTFGGNVDLVNGFYERNFFSLKLRNSVSKFYQNLDEDTRNKLYKRVNRRKMDKDLKRIFPASGAGSVKSVESYSQDILDSTISDLWEHYKNIE